MSLIKCKRAEQSLLARIATVDISSALKPRNGIIYWHISEEDFAKNSIDKYKIIVAFQKGFEVLTPAFFPIRFESTSDRKLAPIELFFKKNGDKGLPEKFDPGVLAYAFFPGATPQGIESNIYFNDELPWEEMHAVGKYSLFKVFVHECLHALGLDHSTIQSDIMYPRYQPNNEIILTGDTLQGLEKLYGKTKEKLALELLPKGVPPVVVDPVLPKPSGLFEWIKSFFRKRADISRLSVDQLETLAKTLDIPIPDFYNQETLRTKIYSKLGI